jgi:hypothetical protein
MRQATNESRRATARATRGSTSTSWSVWFHQKAVLGRVDGLSIPNRCRELLRGGPPESLAQPSCCRLSNSWWRERRAGLVALPCPRANQPLLIRDFPHGPCLSAKSGRVVAHVRPRYALRWPISLFASTIVHPVTDQAAHQPGSPIDTAPRPCVCQPTHATQDAVSLAVEHQMPLPCTVEFQTDKRPGTRFAHIKTHRKGASRMPLYSGSHRGDHLRDSPHRSRVLRLHRWCVLEARSRSPLGPSAVLTCFCPSARILFCVPMW